MQRKIAQTLFTKAEGKLRIQLRPVHKTPNLTRRDHIAQTEDPHENRHGPN
jgi:hypothetical protein